MKRLALALVAVLAGCTASSPTDILDPTRSVECEEGPASVCSETGSLTLEVLVITVAR